MVKIGGLGPLVFEGRGFEEKFSTLNISKTGGAISAKFSVIAGLEGPSLRFGREVGGSSNSGGSRGKVAKNGLAVWRCIALSGSQIFCNVGIFNFFADYVSRDICQQLAYICETL